MAGALPVTVSRFLVVVAADQPTQRARHLCKYLFGLQFMPWFLSEPVQNHKSPVVAITSATSVGLGEPMVELQTVRPHLEEHDKHRKCLASNRVTSAIFGLKEALSDGPFQTARPVSLVDQSKGRANLGAHCLDPAQLTYAFHREQAIRRAHQKCRSLLL